MYQSLKYSLTHTNYRFIGFFEDYYLLDELQCHLTRNHTKLSSDIALFKEEYIIIISNQNPLPNVKFPPSITMVFKHISEQPLITI